MSGIKRFAALLFLTGWLLAPETGWAGCVSRVARPACKPLAGMGTVGLVIEVQEGAAALGISRATMRETARSAIRREIPRLRVEKDTHRAPQIRISAARLGRRDGNPSLHLQIEVRDIRIREGRLIWSSVWLTNYVLPGSSARLAADVGRSLLESLSRLGEDWRRANRNAVSRRASPRP